MRISQSPKWSDTNRSRNIHSSCATSRCGCRKVLMRYPRSSRSLESSVARSSVTWSFSTSSKKTSACRTPSTSSSNRSKRRLPTRKRMTSCPASLLLSKRGAGRSGEEITNRVFYPYTTGLIFATLKRQNMAEKKAKKALDTAPKKGGSSYGASDITVLEGLEDRD